MYAEEIRVCGVSPSKLLHMAKMKPAYISELYKGMRLADFVEVKAATASKLP